MRCLSSRVSAGSLALMPSQLILKLAKQNRMAKPLALDSLLQGMRHPTRKRSVVAAGFLAAMLQDSVQWHAGLECRAKYITEMVQEYDLEVVKVVVVPFRVHPITAIITPVPIPYFVPVEMGTGWPSLVRGHACFARLCSYARTVKKQLILGSTTCDNSEWNQLTADRRGVRFLGRFGVEVALPARTR